MNRIWLVARREFVTTVSRKGFLIGVFLMPVLMIARGDADARASSRHAAPVVAGEVAVIDATLSVRRRCRAARLRRPLRHAGTKGSAGRPEQVHAGMGKRVRRRSAPRCRRNSPSSNCPTGRRSTQQEALAGSDTKSHAVERPASGARGAATANAVTRAPGQDFGSYDLFVSQRLRRADRERSCTNALRLALVRARLTASGVRSRVSSRPRCASTVRRGDRRARRQATQSSRFQSRAALHHGHPAVHRRDHRRPDADDLYRRGEIQPRDRGAAGGGLAARTHVGQAHRPARRRACS